MMTSVHSHSSATLDSLSQMTEKLAAVHSTLAELYTSESDEHSYPHSAVMENNARHSSSAMNQTQIQPQMAVPLVPADSLQATCYRLQCTIARMQETYPVRHTRQINCVFFGRMGNGKSSLINSIYQTLTESRDSLCEVGLGDTSKTLRYACCTELYRRDVLPLVLFDTKGLGDSSDKKTASVVRNILRGRFKAEKPMNRPKWYDYSMVADARLKIDVVLFVYAYGTPFPYQLAQTVCTEAKARGLRVIPVITHFDLVKTAEDFKDDVEKCKMTFNTQPVSLANLGALQPNPVTATNHQLWQAEHWQARSKETILDMVSQILLSGQQHHMSKKYDVHKELSKGGECTIM